MTLPDKTKETNNIWSKDKLNRKDYADFLYQVITSAQVNNDEDNALIFSIDGDWGTGKTFFIDLWMQQLKEDGHLVSRFDAWKNDIIDEPLIGFISHIYAEISGWQEKLPADKYIAGQTENVVNDLAKNAKERIFPILTELVKGLAKKGASYIVTEEAIDLILAANKDAEDASANNDKAVANNLIENKILAHNKNIDLIEEFKKQLTCVATELTAALGKKTPVIIFIDELDRCRPDYAVKLLEVLKHIFNSKGICFIAGVNITQLEHSIKTIYGSEFNAELYLNRFFNYRLLLPKPSIEDYLKSNEYLNENLDVLNNVFEAYGKKKSLYSSNFIITEEANILRKGINENNQFILKICQNLNLKIRDINNLFGKMDLISRILKNQWDNIDVNKDILFLILALIYVNKKIKREDFDLVNPFGSRFEVKSNDIFDTNIILASSRKGDELMKVVAFKEIIEFINFIYNGNIFRAQSRENIEIFNSIKKVMFDSMRINADDETSIRISKGIFDSYIDACFMAATIDPRKDVVLN